MVDNWFVIKYTLFVGEKTKGVFFMERRKKISTKTIAFIGVMVAVLAVVSPIQIPMPSGVPLTLQTFVISLAGTFLLRKWGTISVAIYILIGTIGMPVFAGFGSGIGKLFGYTGGFIWGFLFLAFFSGFQVHAKKVWTRYLLKTLLALIGLILCHILGIIQFSIVSGNPLLASAMLVSIPYLIKDVISIVAAVMIGDLLRKRICP